MQDDVVGAPVGGDRGQATFGQYGQHGRVQAGRAQQHAQAPGLGQVAAGVDEHGIRGRRVGQGRHFGRGDTYRVQQQAE